ncbi:MAG: small multi-drug export protein [Symbiobacteriaceae bacterium]|nr:small multi-drug export protein [Symbiobacteriaceae bacterium]
MPIIELRGAIPVGLAKGMSLPAAFTFSYLGSCLPTLPILLLYNQVIKWLENFSLGRRFVSWMQERLTKHRDKIHRYGYIGLFIFVAIPLPGTGVWSGSALAALLNLSRWRALLAVIGGNLIAGLIITAIFFPMWLN